MISDVETVMVLNAERVFDVASKSHNALIAQTLPSFSYRVKERGIHSSYS